MPSFREINYEVMTDTYKLCTKDYYYRVACDDSINDQELIKETDQLLIFPKKNPNMRIYISKSSTFEACKKYVNEDTKVCALNFANSHSIGGAPYSAGAQEETLCRCSTLYRCLEEYAYDYYQRHLVAYRLGRMSLYGNDDIIYTPYVKVFKTYEGSNDGYPILLDRKDDYNVDVVTCAAPEADFYYKTPDYEDVIRKRIKRILDVCEKKEVDVLVLGAWGCGAFNNDPRVVSKVFMELVPNYSFKTVEFAIYNRPGTSEYNYKVFRDTLSQLKSRYLVKEI